jgi:hypothetical protein
MRPGIMGHDQESRVLVAIAELKGVITNLDKDLKTLQGAGATTQNSVESLRVDMNGRFKKLEHAVFGNEDVNKIGLVEKVRNLDAVAEIVAGDESKGVLPLIERVRSLESGWAKLTAMAVLFCSAAVEILKLGGHWLYGFIQQFGKPHP